MAKSTKFKDLEIVFKAEHNLSGRRIFFRFLKWLAVLVPVFFVLVVVAFYQIENYNRTALAVSEKRR